MKANILAVAVGALIMAGCATAPTQTQKPTPMTHDHHAHAHDHHDHGWNYEHPEAWGDLEVNRLCSTGVEQSPINITTVKQPTMAGKLNLVEGYQAQNFSVKNNGHTIVFDVEGKSNSTVNINGTRYELLQFHYHIPSEHTVMNAHYPLEIHFVHKNANNGLAVVGVLVNSGQYNANLNRIITGLPANGADGKLMNFNIGTLMPKDGTAYAYDGSLTTPPCSEKVQWILKASPIEADNTQLGVLSKLYNGNNRPVQPQGSRDVMLVQ